VFELLDCQRWGPLCGRWGRCAVPCDDERVNRATTGAARDLSPVYAAGVLRTRFRGRIRALAASDGTNDGIEHTYTSKIGAGDRTRCSHDRAVVSSCPALSTPSPGIFLTWIRRHISTEHGVVGVGPGEQCVRRHPPAYPRRLRRFRREPHQLAHRLLVRSSRTGQRRFDRV